MAIEIIAILGFILAAWSVVANDSVQTLGTFIASNSKVKWYYLWIFASAILLAAFLYSWLFNGGDITYGRLDLIPYDGVKWYHLLAPITLIILTRLRIPVSTSLLVLSAFASSIVFEKIIIKSALGYGMAAIVAYILWILIRDWEKGSSILTKAQENKWRIFEWCATGFLWFTWLSHDAANVAVFLPRDISLELFIFVVLVFIGGLGVIFYRRGGGIQEIVLTKSNVNYVRSATIIDLTYALILLILKEWSSIPMSTTWVFIGLLTGRELAINTLLKREGKTDLFSRNVFPIVKKDFLKLILGLGVSVVIAVLIQKVFQGVY